MGINLINRRKEQNINIAFFELVDVFLNSNRVFFENLSDR